jgi:hypothetical protein
MKLTIAAIALSLIAGQAMAAPKYVVSAGSIVCMTEDAYDAQMAALGQGYDKTVDLCGIAGRAIPVIVISQNLFSASVVQSVNGGTRLYVGIESIAVK